ncbi:MAG: polymerase beta domain protein region protein [Berkelbacteria bacterium GW2011_GWA1_36_9]|uniref:Polymerase beta domain protein region protein n=1 Tax=Berkelbacteria bacterium GW2011_GWA1_36_9 TaxID=1618331 RepID=A0A0G0FLK9_9BACT|nr:MAG: polymerase beta domain protein region protein [Berkelbacteria bacterium GW2011_GWA1_36_9]
MSSEIQEQLNLIVQSIIRETQPERIILFGSYANGKPRKDSDFDLFIVKNTTLRSVDRDQEIRKVLPFNRKKGVDLIVLTSQEVDQAFREKNIFIHKIFKEGKELYAKNKRIYGLVQKSSR